MNTMELVRILLIINAIVAAVYILFMSIIRRAGMRGWLNGLMMLLCPLVGTIMVIVGAAMHHMIYKQRDVDLEAVSFSHEKTKFIFAPDDDERELVPIEESLLVATHTERRKAFLKSIRLNVNKDLTLYSLALDNDDAETSHYSASIVMEAMATFQDRLRDLEVAYEQHPENLQLTRDYMENALAFLKSGSLSGVELMRYQQLYIRLAERLRTEHPELLMPEDYVDCTRVLLDSEYYDQAEGWAKEGLSRYPDEESSHMSLLRVYYAIGDTRGFTAALDRLKRSYIQISRDGISLIRFFSGAMR